MTLFIFLCGLAVIVGGLCGLLDHIERQPSRMESKLYADWLSMRDELEEKYK